MDADQVTLNTVLTRIEHIETRIEAIEKRLDQIDRRFEYLERRMDRMEEQNEYDRKLLMDIWQSRDVVTVKFSKVFVGLNAFIAAFTGGFVSLLIHRN